MKYEIKAVRGADNRTASASSPGQTLDVMNDFLLAGFRIVDVRDDQGSSVDPIELLESWKADKGIDILLGRS